LASQTRFILKTNFRFNFPLGQLSLHKASLLTVNQLVADLNSKMAVMAGNTNGVKAQAASNKVKSKNQYKREKAKLKKQAAAAAPTPVSP